jgi:hypothetical protein
MAAQRKLHESVLETARTLIHNRLPNLCFTRDRLLFYEQQQSAARRAGWERQDFSFEVAYYLNFYYLLIYGGFDHIAQLVNGVLALGVPERRVGATYTIFLDALHQRAPNIHALFTDPKLEEFIKRIGALRHVTAHRGSITPAKVYETPPIEPTDQELDAEISATGADHFLAWLPPEVAKRFRNTLRVEARLARCEQVAEGLVMIEIDGKPYCIRPISDTEWNFDMFHKFLRDVVQACSQVI